MTFEVFGQASAASDPGEGALDDPTLGEHDEAVKLATRDDADLPGSSARSRRSQLRPAISGIREDALDEGKEATRAPIEDEARPVAILHVGGMDDDVQQEAERIDENMPLATLDLLARVKTRRIKRCPPFCAPLALWGSMTAAVALASRPARSRTAT
jgi:hypothetical protein